VWISNLSANVDLESKNCNRSFYLAPKRCRFRTTKDHETRARETKVKCVGMLHTHPQMKVIDDEIGPMGGGNAGKRRIAESGPRRPIV
jgi:hypothetical protein